MQKTHLEYNVRKAIEALQHLQQDGYHVEDETQLIWKDKFYDLFFEIQNHLKMSEALLEDMKTNGLTIGTADAEGHVRSSRYMMTIAKQIADEAEHELGQAGND